jgi:hypothetical protein
MAVAWPPSLAAEITTSDKVASAENVAKGSADSIVARDIRLSDMCISGKKLAGFYERWRPRQM